MMLYKTSYKNDKIRDEINRIVGTPFSFMQRIRMGRIGSSRMVLSQVSPKYYEFLNDLKDLKYVNIELRPKGILVHLNQSLDRYSWPIPYYQLSFFDSDLFSIHANGNFIKLRKDQRYKSNISFINRILTIRNESLSPL